MGTSLNFWGNRLPFPGKPLGWFTSMGYLLKKVRTPTASLVGDFKPHLIPACSKLGLFNILNLSLAVCRLETFAWDI